MKFIQSSHSRQTVSPLRLCGHLARNTTLGLKLCCCYCGLKAMARVALCVDGQAAHRQPEEAEVLDSVGIRQVAIQIASCYRSLYLKGFRNPWVPDSTIEWFMLCSTSSLFVGRAILALLYVAFSTSSPHIRRSDKRPTPLS